MQEKNHKNSLWNSTLTVAAILCPLVLLFFYYTLFCITFSKITYVNCILRTKGLIMTCLGLLFLGGGAYFFNWVFLTVPMFRVIHWLISKHNCPWKYKDVNDFLDFFETLLTAVELYQRWEAELLSDGRNVRGGGTPLTLQRTTPGKRILLHNLVFSGRQVLFSRQTRQWWDVSV